MKKRKNRSEKTTPFAEYTKEMEAASRNGRYDLADAIFDKYVREMTVGEQSEAKQFVRFVRDFDHDPMYCRMSGPQTEGLFLAYRELKKSGSGSVHVLVDFLEADLNFFASGYIKEAILHLLKRQSIAFGADLDDRLRHLILGAIQETPKRQSRYYWRLAPRVSTSRFVDEVIRLTEHPLAYVRKNASAVMNVLQSAAKKQS